MAIYAVSLVDKDIHFPPIRLGYFSGVSSEREAIEKARKRYRALTSRFETGKFYFGATLVDTKDQPRSGH